jgi:hypothetical protein
VVVGLPLRGVRTPCGQSGVLHGFELVPAKWRYLLPSTSTPQKHAGHKASRWALAGQVLYSSGNSEMGHRTT